MDANSELCSKLLHLVSLGTPKSLSQMRRSLSSQPAEVVQLFIDNSGCERIFEVMNAMAEGPPSVSVVVEALRAIKAVMRDKYGLEYVARNPSTPMHFSKSERHFKIVFLRAFNEVGLLLYNKKVFMATNFRSKVRS